MKDTNKNFLYNLLYQVFIFIIPLITIPYVSRVLGADNIGIYSYTYSLINYFMLASMLGINNYGSREIAKVCNNIEMRSKKFYSIYFLQSICTCIMCILFFFFFFFIIKYDYKTILLIQFIYLLSCAFDINWYFFGVEKFKITISRNIIIKTLSLLFIFIFVKSKNDLWIYTLILASSTLISQIYLWFFIKKEVIRVSVNRKDIFNHLSKCLVLFLPVVAYSIYRIMDKTMIGFFSNTFQLGNYENAEKIITIPLSIISALGVVMLPHMSKTNNSDFDKKITSTFELCFFMLFPIFIGLFIIADDFSIVFFGKEFVYASNLIRILLITIIFSGITNVVRNNYLIPKSKDKIYVTSTIYGAIVNFILNLIFIRKYGAYGACIGTISAEFIVMVYQVINTRKNINYKYIFFKVQPFLYKAIIMGVIVFLWNFIPFKSLLIKIIVQILTAITVYFILNYKYIIYDFLGIKRKNKNNIELS